MKKLENIFQQIKTEVDSFIDDDVEVVDGYIFNQYDTIKRCHLYYNSQFEDNSDYNGREKIFYQISKYRCMSATRLMDVDTKDIRLLPLNPKSRTSTFLLEKELQLWLKQNKVANILNTIAEELPIYGSTVIKKNKNSELGAEVCDLRRLFLDPTVDSIADSRFVTQKHYLTASQLRAMKGKWENVDKVIDKFEDHVKESYEDDEFRNHERSTPYYVIYERYGEVPESWLKDGGDEDKMVRSLFITTDPDNSDSDSEGIVLFKGAWNGEYPFKDIHYSKTRGRWLGIGVMEDLFPVQERINEISNQKRIAMEVSSMVLFQTSDQTILQNILSDKQSGDVIRKSPNSEGLAAVNNTVKNFGEFKSEEESYGILADRLSYSNDVVRGGEIAASTPATNAMIQNNNSSSVFLYKRENFTNALRDFMNDLVAPKLVKDLSAEHILRYTGSVEEINKLDEKIVDSLTRDAVIDRMLSGKLVTPEEKQAIHDELNQKLKKQGEERFLKIKEGLYSDTAFEFDFIINNEQENMSLLAQNTFSVMSSLAQNPGMLEDPRIKALFYEYMQRVGVSPGKIELAEREAVAKGGQMPQREAGGGLEQIAERIQQLNTQNANNNKQV